MPALDSILAEIIPNSKAKDQAEAWAPVNIALCKYWGKRDRLLNLPLTDSLSISLGSEGTHTRIKAAERCQFILNGIEQDPQSPASQRLWTFIKTLTPESPALRVESENSLPTAAGLASSASAFAALVKALDQFWNWNLDQAKLSILARLGSGSACRSIHSGFVHWQAGQREDGMDSYATPLKESWDDLRISLLQVDDSAKEIGSREAMNRTCDSSVLYQSWPAQVEKDLPLIKNAIKNHDFDSLGRTSERNAIAMHATMFAADPAIIYWRPQSLERIQQIRDLRQEGLRVYFTMDAGPNLKLIHLAQESDKLQDIFPKLKTIEPFSTKA